MPPVALNVKSIGSAHESYPDTNAIEGSGDTTVNSLEVHCESHALASHGSPSPSGAHPRALAQGSPDTYINSLQAGRIGDPVDCGGLIVTGSSDTIIN